MTLLATMVSGLMISGCNSTRRPLPDPGMQGFAPSKHQKVGKVHGIRGDLLKDGGRWTLVPKRDGTYLCIKVSTYKQIKQACNDTLYDLRRCDAIDEGNVRKCNALIASYNKE